jgi:hypothetical protein
MINTVPEGMEFDEKKMRFDLNHAMRNDRVFGAFRLYGMPAEGGSLLSKPLYGRKYYAFRDFELALIDMQDNCQKWSEIDPMIQISHALVYVMDGSGGKPKFQAHLWKPKMGHRLTKIDYSRMHDGTNPYEPHALAALLEQDHSTKVSTIANTAFKMIGNRISTLHPSVEGYGKDIHLLMLRKTLTRLMHVNPTIMFERGDDPRGYGTKIEHLGIYDDGQSCL